MITVRFRGVTSDCVSMIFGMFLKRNPDFTGYVAFYKSPKESNMTFQNRIKRVKKYLVNHRFLNLEKSRFVFVTRQVNAEKQRTILQPTSRNVAPPKFP